MKNGILVCSGNSDVKNIGDYIQSVAQEQFFEHVDCFVERESLHDYQSSERTKLIMNAWFMHNPSNFPPSTDIEPLFTSMHIVPRIENLFFSANTIDYLKKYAPIGARDTGSLMMFQKYGIDSYFSGCLTLTLGYKYKKEKHSDQVIFVDPYFEALSGSRFNMILNTIKLFFKHFCVVRKFYKKFNTEFNVVTQKTHIPHSISKLMTALSFYDSYRHTFSDEVLINAEYITHKVNQNKFNLSNDNGNEEKMEYAKELIEKYASAKYVVTSRIHCSLPCLGIETPVMFVSSPSIENGQLRSGGRLGGLKDLLNSVTWSHDGLIGSSNFQLPSKVTKDYSFANRDEYKKLRDSLIIQVKNFIDK